MMGRGKMHVSGEKTAKGTWGKLLRYCSRHVAAVIIAVVCAAGGTVLTLIGPDRLAEMTDVITEGIAPDSDKLEEIMETMSDQLSGNTEKLISSITDNVSANLEAVANAVGENLAVQPDMEAKSAAILSADDISDGDKTAFQNYLSAVSSGASPEEAQAMLMELPDAVLSVLYDEVEAGGVVLSAREQLDTMNILRQLETADEDASAKAIEQLPEQVKTALYTEITVNDVFISGEEQLDTLELLSDVDTDDTEAAAQAMGGLPDAVKDALYTEITVDGTAISGSDQQEMISLLENVDENDTDAALKAMDELPESIYGLVKPSIDIEKVGRIGLLLVVMYVLSMALSAGQGWIMATVTQKVSKKLRGDISAKINRLPMGYYHKTQTGDVLSRVTNDVDTIGQTMNMSIGMLVSAVTLFIGSLVMMLKTDLVMTAAGVAATIIGFVLMMLIMGRSQKYFMRQQRHLGALNGHIEEIYSGHTVVKAYNGEEKAIKEFHKLNQKLMDSGFKAQALSGLMMPIMTFIGNFGYVVVCIVGAALVLKGRISFGVIVSFMLYIRFFTQPLSQIAQAMQSLQQAGAASSRVFEFLEAEEMEDESQKEKRSLSANGNVSFSHVRFGYDPDKIIIKDFSADVKAGQKIAIVGPTGAGKTTLVNLLMRFYEINNGEIKIDGIPTSSMKREDVHAQFCMVLQDTWVFEGTVRENLIYCSENQSEEKMKQACKAVGLDHFIRTLPNGYDTILNDQVSLSQGQKQQLTIARAMIADKPILILDEATSSIDTRTELKIQKAMDILMENRTSFVIAHRLSTIKNSDLILVLKDGDIIESGNHDTLMQKQGFYAELYNSQFDTAS